MFARACGRVLAEHLHLPDRASVRMPIDVFTANFGEIELVSGWHDD